MKSLIYTVCITRYCVGLFCKKVVRNITTLIYAHLYIYLYTVLLPLPPFSFFGFCPIFGGAKTEKPVPRRSSVFLSSETTQKRLLLYAGYQLTCDSNLR